MQIGHTVILCYTIYQCILYITYITIYQKEVYPDRLDTQQIFVVYDLSIPSSLDLSRNGPPGLEQPECRGAVYWWRPSHPFPRLPWTSLEKVSWVVVMVGQLSVECFFVILISAKLSFSGFWASKIDILRCVPQNIPEVFGACKT